MKYFDVKTKEWKCFPSMATLDEATACFCAEYVGNYLYVAAETRDHVIYRYHSVNNEWETLPYFQSSHSYASRISCLCSVGDYIFAITNSNVLQRYSLAQNKWQSGSTLPFLKKIGEKDKLTSEAAVVVKSKIYVLFGYCTTGMLARAVFYCFDPQKNEWKEKASTSHPHFESVLFVDNNKLYVAGGRISFYGGAAPAPVEVYDEVRNMWSVVEQKHIPPNNLGAVEINEKVYFIINKFPIDIGIRIPPGEVYHISLHKWEEGARGIGKINENAVLCYLPVKKDSLKAKPTSEKKSDVKRNFRKK